MYTATIYVKQLLLPAASSRQKQLFDIQCCRMHSFDLLMMERPSETCRAFYKNK
jgi:hypothetical protein